MRTRGEGAGGMKKLRRETTRENKVEERKRDRGTDGTWEDIFALSSRARSYYRHTWCNILPLIFASVRGFLLRPRRDFTSTHAVRDATGGSLPRREWRAEGRAEDDRMLPKFAKSREDDTSILSSPNSAPFRFRSRKSSRSREKLARRSGVGLRARSRSWHRRRLPLLSPLHVLRRSPDIVHPCLAIMASAHRIRRRLLSPFSFTDHL